MEIRLTARDQWQGPNSPPFFDKAFVDSRITIGNDPAASLYLNGSVLAAEQIVIVNSETGPEIMNQAEGTLLNGEVLALHDCRPLQNGDLLVIGTYSISIFLGGETSASYSTAPNHDLSINRRNGSSNAFVGDDTLEDFLTATEKELASALPTAELTDVPQADTTQRSRSPKSFGAILDSLRTDEDRFYFVVEDGRQSGVRVPIELDEMPLGWDETGEFLCFDISSIADLCAVARKDWSGVVLQTQTASGITVNNEPLDDQRRLRDGDRLSLSVADNEATPGSQVVLVFREPTSLVILDSLMPRVPLLRENAESASAEASLDRATRLGRNTAAKKLAALIKSDREYFSVFTFVELLLMAVGTIVGAIIIFLILNYS